MQRLVVDNKEILKDAKTGKKVKTEPSGAPRLYYFQVIEANPALGTLYTKAAGTVESSTPPIPGQNAYVLGDFIKIAGDKNAYGVAVQFYKVK